MKPDKKNVKDSSAEDPVPESSLQEPMCIISKADLETIYIWLNSDRMTMPQNEVRYHLKLLLTAKLVEIEK